MPELNAELESRFIKLTLSSVLQAVEALHPDVDMHATVRQHMLGICAGVRERALAAAGSEVAPEEATAHVDALSVMINDYLDYSASPLSPRVNIITHAE